MIEVTFRTESTADDDRARYMLALLGITMYRETTFSDEAVPFYKMTRFTFYTKNVEQLRSSMEHMCENYDALYDLHRCYETLEVVNDARRIN